MYFWATKALSNTAIIMIGVEGGGSGQDPDCTAFLRQRGAGWGGQTSRAWWARVVGLGGGGRVRQSYVSPSAGIPPHDGSIQI